MHAPAVLLQAFVAAAILFVWGVRYQNIVEEFRQYRYPEWLRDSVGILKLTFVILLLYGMNHPRAALLGASGIALLMFAAVVTHLRVKNPPFKALPSIVLLLCSIAIALLNYRLYSMGS